MSGQPASADGPFSLMMSVEEVCNRFEAAWKAGERPRIEDHLSGTPGLTRPALLRELLLLELAHRRRQGESPAADEYRQRFPEHAAVVRSVFDQKAAAVGKPAAMDAPSAPQVATTPDIARSYGIECPERLGRYRVESLLGRGGFGQVFLAHDDQLHRPVAIKVPHRERVSRPEDAEAYMAEARVLAGLDHPHIVPVFDIGATEDGLPFVVSKFIEGRDLKEKIKDARPSFGESAELVATIAEALHYAHRKGLVHRDIKPGNVLIDGGGKPHVADFGLALTERDFGKVAGLAGTPAYMSPEQARGEGHRVDGRSDIFSLGVVLYELLTGQRPFRSETREELLEQITSFEPRPLRQMHEDVPKELERICFKALSKRASERYMTAKDMADDLRHLLAEQAAGQQPGAEKKDSGSRPVIQVAPSSPGSEVSVSSSTATQPPSDSRPVKIVPKGLRSFDAHDADFFLELLPGARDRDGLPESIRFWKTPIEETDPDNTFAVGLIYGPSGCGKSSLVKAGLLPRLAPHVIPVYVEATAHETEARLLNGIRKRCQALPENLGLKETLAALRRGQGLAAGKKVLIVLDQFEQWLHAGKAGENTELVQALRQCDGGRVQCVVMVRDDFWMAATRFMRELEIRLLEGHNSAAVDLFPLRHAERVLAAFGRAFGVLPDSTDDIGKGQKTFLEQAVSGLAQDGKVICVRLALFAEMMKGKPWTPATLKEVGGTEGVGVTFLEETFSAATAPPEHRYHQRAARAVLNALLPESGTDIKGHMRSYAELLSRSGCANRPRDFDELIRILDGEIRLITPTDPEGMDGEGDQPQPAAGGRFYQLAHDYLVHPLRDWLTRKQKETRRGRAELRLAERAALWHARPENRHLPAWWEWANIRLFTRKKDWTPSQRAMMRKATHYHAVQGLALAVLLLAVLLIGLGLRGQVIKERNTAHADGLVRRLLDVDTAQVPGVVAEMEGYRAWTDPKLRAANAEAAEDSRQKLHTSLALLPVDGGQVAYLSRRLLEAGPAELPVIRDALTAYRGVLVGRLWGVLGDEQADPDQRLRAACALATYDAAGGDENGERWAAVSKFVTGRLLAAVQQNPSHYTMLLGALQPVRDKLLGPLSEVFRGRERAESERSWATSILADYAADANHLGLLSGLLMDADEKQFVVLYPKFKGHGDQGLPLLYGELDKHLPDDAQPGDKEALARRHANAAVALLKMGQAEKVWPLLRHRPDPSVRSYLIHRLSPLGVDPRAVVKRLEDEKDPSVRRALFLALGEYGEKGLPAADRDPLLSGLLDLYRDDPDPGLHGAAEWLLRQWGQHEKLAEIDRKLATGKLEGPRRWYVNGQGQTMVLVPGPARFLMGSPRTEAGRERGPEGNAEMQHEKSIDRTFSVAARQVTVEQFLRFRKDHAYAKDYSPRGDFPVNAVTWYEAAAYCNWLSKQEGLPGEEWCYLPGKDDDYGEGMKLAPDYLHRTGYRLPTEAEWEYACRAGALTSRYYGEGEDLLGKYAWYAKNSLNRRMLPVGSLKPNDFGLFDVLGNALEWCQDQVGPYAPGEDVEGVRDIRNADRRILRNGSFNSLPWFVRSAHRFGYLPMLRVNDVGFRPARTFR